MVDPLEGTDENGTPYKALVIDPSVATRRIIANALRSVKYTVVGEASNGQQGLALSKANAPAVVFINYQLPGEDSLKIMKTLFAELNTVKVIMISDNKYAFAEQEAISLGATFFYILPIERGKFLEIVKRAVSA